ncbi:MAG: CcoQ/FixQ family Cbb3-type cytochrome c oxidase assembly chaperone [Flavobacteriales bacterium]|jgi:hypothetical protein|nr:CcoQ/FixQ family Cbb3-type cytochrome c oxidase assembly chaperone [Flavobacteriales bacterium]MBK7942429.1 CcoQ/FixQ family Cbb3-type cytochrome c oxidase assembly chaperone [Flavobacteriales bacterium]MBK8948245.1 CcoQ/FixQ family Cbb3-type cytochrome c oxidase assembly chaperone [Flavobacteriales bacterium]MBK9699171.1 CcoQ/FixQ family Cbb3-type cytochrome c oxidase assembly chaperone [Flavobacteriales bacterium]
MLKFIKHHLNAIEGVDLFPLLAFVIFLTVFIAASLLVLTSDRRRIKHLEELPFSDIPTDRTLHP